MKAIECIARAIIEEDDKILLCHGKGLGNWFFPGGHIEEGESAPDALVREIKEELGEEAEVLGFLGVSENKFDKDGDTHEINLVFKVRISSNGEKVSQENHLEFAWFTREEMRNMVVFPLSLRDAVLTNDELIWVSEGF